jgi:hypothetical protein
MAEKRERNPRVEKSTQQKRRKNTQERKKRNKEEGIS